MKNNISFSNVIICKGIPASGKSTWSKEQVKQNPFKVVRVCRDDFRTMLSGYVFSKENEDLVTLLRDQAICTALKMGYDVIIDETSLNEKLFGKIVSLIKKLNINCKITEKPFYISFEEACQRNTSRDRVVPDHIMKKMWLSSGENNFKNYKGRSETVLANDKLEHIEMSNQLNDITLPKAILIDLDGTISLFNKPGDNKYYFAHERNPYDGSNCNLDSPNEPVVTTVNMYYNAGYKIIFCSGREDKYRPQTLEFLDKNLDSVQYDLYMRQSGDLRKDWVVKEQMLKQNIVGKYRIFFALDDRNMMVDYYRSLGINTWQVASGNF